MKFIHHKIIFALQEGFCWLMLTSAKDDFSQVWDDQIAFYQDQTAPKTAYPLHRDCHQEFQLVLGSHSENSKINIVCFSEIDPLSLSIFTKIADIEATIAGVPNPWLIIEKWVKCLWTPGSMIGWGLVLQRGDLSWFRKSTNSLQINLQHGN